MVCVDANGWRFPVAEAFCFIPRRLFKEWKATAKCLWLMVVRIRIGQLQLVGYQCEEILWDADPGICRIRGLTATGRGDDFGM